MAGWEVLGVYEREAGSGRSKRSEVVASLRRGDRLDIVVLGDPGSTTEERDDALRAALAERGVVHPTLQDA